MSSIALKTVTSPIPLAAPMAPVVRHAGLRQVLAHRWDLYAVLILLGSSAAYAIYTLLHLA